MVIYVNVNIIDSCRGHLVLFLMHNLYTRVVVQQQIIVARLRMQILRKV